MIINSVDTVFPSSIFAARSGLRGAVEIGELRVKKTIRTAKAFSPKPSEIVSPKLVYSTPEEGMEMMSAFARIRDTAARKALIKIASDLANGAATSTASQRF